ncbi:MAG TPA: hypothetical protein VKH81_09175 [Candidatus Angelobacter sp.]|nr:hypothetical protein [Candidatus Angelobacter sp.]
MNCQQFQEVLPYIIESGGKPEEETHLETCASCSALVEDLRYIAEQAKLLLPMHDPNPRVWTSIEQSLHREGLLPATEGRMSLAGHLTKTSTQTQNWTPVGWVLALASVVLFAFALTNYRTRQLPSSQLSAQNVAADSASTMDRDDQQLIAQVAQEDPAASGAYENSLREVNSYIADAQQAAQADPDDAEARELLQDAYQQKEMLYQMATARSLP